MTHDLQSFFSFNRNKDHMFAVFHVITVLKLLLLKLMKYLEEMF